MFLLKFARIMSWNSLLSQVLINPFTTSVPHHIKTSQLICNANQLTGLYMMGNFGRQWVKCLRNFRPLTRQLNLNVCKVTTEKHLSLTHFLIKLQSGDLQLYQKDTLKQCIPLNFDQFLATPTLQNICKKLFLWLFFLKFHFFLIEKDQQLVTA